MYNYFTRNKLTKKYNIILHENFKNSYPLGRCTPFLVVDFILNIEYK